MKKVMGFVFFLVMLAIITRRIEKYVKPQEHNNTPSTQQKSL